MSRFVSGLTVFAIALSAASLPARAGLLEMLFGPQRDARPAYPLDEPGPRVLNPSPTPKASLRSSGRQVCVRMCDGFYYPLDSVATRGGDALGACESSCPGAEMAVFRTSGDDMAEARDAWGRRYGDLQNAFSYRKTFAPACGCQRRPDAAGVMADMTLRKGDIVVTADGAVVFRGEAGGVHSPADFQDLRAVRDLPKGVFAQADRVLGFTFQQGLARQAAVQLAAKPAEKQDIVVTPVRVGAARPAASVESAPVFTGAVAPRVVLPRPGADGGPD
ncbi:MAG: DUF2865 domain-containing protein [Alsobacter sp.]